MKKLILCWLFALCALVSRGVTMTTAERMALALDASDAGYNVWDSDLSALMIWSGTGWIGYPLGVPYAPQVGEKRIGIVAGLMRQDSANRTHWNYISNATTRPIGVAGTYAVASGSQITITYTNTYAEVLTGIVAPDEEWANVTGLSVGASIGLSSAVIKMASYLTGSFTGLWNGSNWVLTSSGTSLTPTVRGYTNGVLTIDHTYARGLGKSVIPWSNSGAITNPYCPIIYTIANEYFQVHWMDFTTGNLISSATPTNRMTFSATLSNNGGLFVDGSNYATNFLTMDPTTSADISFFILLRE